jgi:hypothetical protein
MPDQAYFLQFPGRVRIQFVPIPLGDVKADDGDAGRVMRSMVLRKFSTSSLAITRMGAKFLKLFS